MAADGATRVATVDIASPTDIGGNAAAKVASVLNPLLADLFALYVKTKNFHWHMSGPHFRDYHLLLDEQATQIFAITDAIAERVRKLGQPTLHSIGQISSLQRISDNDADYVTPAAMLGELHRDHQQLIGALRAAHEICEQSRDVASASLLETYIDEAERRSWFLFEATRSAGA